VFAAVRRMNTLAGARSEVTNDTFSVAVSNDLPGLTHGLHALGDWLRHHKVGLESENAAHLVFEEIVTNIIRYAFSDAREHRIAAEGRMSADEIRLTFEDDGKPFDPRSVPTPVPSKSLAKATIGGRGLMLVRKAAKAIEYERTADDRNRLTITLPRV
jgi:sigma-B regulation protein RsbU (phosphoserine phosphatase)